MSENLVYTPPATVALFMQCDAKVRVLQGPVGSGKSVGCVMEIPRRAAATPPGPDGIRRSRWAVVRNTMPQLKDTTIKTFLDWLKPGVAGEWQLTEKTFTLRFADVEAEIQFRALDDAKDVAKLLSLELTGAWLNECRTIPKEIVEGLMKRIGRYPSKKDIDCDYWHGIWADTNPPSVDTWWWRMMEKIDGENGWAVFKQPSGRSPEAENIENLPEGYYDTTGLSEDFIKVYIDGLYGMSRAGVPVYDKTFKSDLHEDRTLAPVPFASTPIIIGMDFGRTPACAIGQVQGGGRVALLDELTSFNMGLEVFIREKLRPLLNSSKYMGAKFVVIGDPAGRAKSSISEENSFDTLKRYGFTAFPASTNDPDARIRAVERGLLELVEGVPAFRINPDTCPMLTRGFQYGYVYKEVKNSDGVLKVEPHKNEFSHPHDALQYLMLYAMGAGGALKPQNFSREGYFGDGVSVGGYSPRPNASGWT